MSKSGSPTGFSFQALYDHLGLAKNYHRTIHITRLRKGAGKIAEHTYFPDRTLNCLD